MGGVENPHSFASSGRSDPVGREPSKRRGIAVGASAHAASISGDQRRPPTSSQSVPDASDASVARSPVSSSRSQSFGSSTCAVCAKTSGSWRATQRSFGAVKPGIAALPVICRDRGSRASSSAHSAWLRPSFHRIAGRRTRSFASSSVAPCICPERPIPRTAANAAGASSRTRARASEVALHQLAGDCSDQSGCGRSTVSGALASPTMRCSPSTSRAFTLDVPTSMPRYMLLLRPLPASPAAPQRLGMGMVVALDALIPPGGISPPCTLIMKLTIAQ